MVNKRDKIDTLKRRTKEPPEKLKELLKLVNALPHDAKIRPMDDLRTALMIPYDIRRLNAQRAFESNIGQLPDLLQEFIRKPCNSDPSDSYEQAVARYDRLLDARDFLRSIAKENFGIWERAKSYDEQQMLEYWKRTGIGTLSSRLIPIDWSLNSEGFLDPQLSSWMQNLRGVEVVRIRQCPICDSIYYAGRIDKSTCSDKCSQVWRQRLTRDAWKNHGEQYRVARKKKEKSAGGDQPRSKE